MTEIGILLHQVLNKFFENEVTILHACAFLMCLTGVIVFFILIFIIPAPYGRYSCPGSGFFYYPVPARLAWFLQEVPAFALASLVIVAVYLEIIPGSYGFLQLTVLSCFLLHYFQRSFIYSFLITGGKPTPFYAFFLALVFCTGNGYMQARAASLLSSYPDTMETKVRVAVGLCLFTFGMCANIHSDYILRNLRKPGETGYKIPSGGLFNYVSCANFLGEIIEWIGFAIASWSSVSFGLAFFTAANLIPRAISHHRFYLKKFENYPRKRKAVIPYLL